MMKNAEMVPDIQKEGFFLQLLLLLQRVKRSILGK